MSNNYGIPAEVELEIRKRDVRCAYCHRHMEESRARGYGKMATIEHLDEEGPGLWEEGLRKSGLVICCGSCNSSRGIMSLSEWFRMPYCVERSINSGTVAEPVKAYIRKRRSS